MPVIEIVGQLLRLVLDLVGHDKAQELLSKEAVAWANKTADEMEKLKWPS